MVSLPVSAEIMVTCALWKSMEDEELILKNG